MGGPSVASDMTRTTRPMSKPAARLTDMHVCPMVTGLVPHVGGPIVSPGHPQTLIAGLPAARVTDMAVCVGPPDTIILGSFTVLIGGLAAARMGDSCTHGGTIVMGCPTVLIGDSGSGSASPQGMVMSAARAMGKPFTRTNCAAKAALAAQADSPLFAEGEPTKTSWIEVALVDEDGRPVPYQRYRVIAPDGKVREGFLDAKGLARVSGIDPGTCRITFPEFDKEVWNPQ